MKALLRNIVVLLLTLGTLWRVGVAASYPSQSMRIIVPYAAGGTDEYFARIVARDLTKQWGQNVIVEPRPGAGGNIGSAVVARAAPDGYTLLAATSGSNAINPGLYAKMPYDASKDLTLVATLAKTANVLVASPKAPFHTVKQLIAYAKDHPGKVTFASSGIGSVLQLSGVMLGHMTGISMLHIPYSGTAPALVAVMGRQVDMMFANAPSVINLIKAGSLTALAVTGTHRIAALPQVPTMSEAGVPGYNLISWFGVMVPAGTPSEVVDKLNGEIDRMLRKPRTAALFAKQGSTPLIMNAPQSEKFFLAQLKKWADIVKISGVKLE